MSEVTTEKSGHFEFIQKGNGDVLIYYENDNVGAWEEQFFEDGIVVSAHIWASIIANMSYYGEEDYGYYRALDFHAKIKADPITTPIRDKPLPENW